MKQLRPGTVISTRELLTTRSQRIQLPDPTGVVHLQFRRYASGPCCNLHLRSIAQRHQKLVAAGRREMVVFQWSRAELLAQQGEVPFAVIADPARRPYAGFGVASSPRAVLDPHAWLAGVRAVARKRRSLRAGSQQALGLPAAFWLRPTATSWPASTVCTPTTGGRWTTSCSLPASTSQPPTTPVRP